MKIQEVNACVDAVKKDLGDALISTSIVGTRDGQAIAQYNADGKTAAVAAQMTSLLQEVLSKTEFKKLEKYFFLELDSNVSALFILFDKYVWAVAFDSSKSSMGMMLNVYLDDLINKFEAAIA